MHRMPQQKGPRDVHVAGTQGVEQCGRAAVVRRVDRRAQFGDEVLDHWETPVKCCEK